ncbi:Uncharacterized protein GBIM_07223 [Gryllus bimaculatus]|nr:Uncharacterized protein GBIM_07223 [Gryllus bimaculatus]
MQEISTYVRSKQIPAELHRRIVQYYEFRFEMCYFDEREILSALSTNLRQECLLHSCRRLLLNVSFFNNLPASLLLRIMVCLHAEIYLVNDVIISAGTLEDSMYFITSGTVAVYGATGKEPHSPVCILIFSHLVFILMSNARRSELFPKMCEHSQEKR